MQGIPSVYAIIVQGEPDKGILEVFKVDSQGFAYARVQAVAEEVQLPLLDLGHDGQGHNGLLVTL